jgi:hypothetical protein
MLHGHSYMVLPRHGILSGAAVATDQLLLHIPQLLVREEEPCQLELEGNGHCRSARYLNLWLARLLFSYEQLADGQQNLVCRDCLNTFEATSGYCVTVTVQHRPFPGVSCKGVCLQYNVLPFGLAQACRTFTVVTRRIAQPLCAAGGLLTFHPDDLFLAHRSLGRALFHTLSAVKLCGALGWHLASARCRMWPTQEAQLLGPAR